MLRTSLPAALLVALPLVALACGDELPPAPPPPAVTVEQPTRRVVERYAEFTGTTRAVEYAEIRARVSGSLDDMLFEPSTVVEEGTVLFEIEPETYQAYHAEAVANLAAARSQLARAESDLSRMSEAIASRAVSQVDFDLAKAERDQAYAGVLVAEAALAKADIELGYTHVQSPITGQVGRNLVDVGNLVGAGEPTLLTTVARIQPIFVYFDAPEAIVLAMLKYGQTEEQVEPELLEALRRVRVATAADDGFPHMGRIDFIDNTVKESTGTIELRAVLPNANAQLFPGLFVRIRGLGGPEREALLVNERAIGTDLGGKYVLVLGEGDVVEQRYVKLGPVQDDGSVVVDEGLDGSERYIVDGLLRARPGFPVTPQTAAEVEAARQQAAAEGS